MMCCYTSMVVILAHFGAEMAKAALCFLGVILWFTHLSEAETDSKDYTLISFYSVQEGVQNITGSVRCHHIHMVVIFGSISR